MIQEGFLEKHHKELYCENMYDHTVVSSLLFAGSLLKSRQVPDIIFLYIIECGYFIKTDTGLINKKIYIVQIINQIDFIRNMEGYNEN